MTVYGKQDISPIKTEDKTSNIRPKVDFAEDEYNNENLPNDNQKVEEDILDEAVKDLDEVLSEDVDNLADAQYQMGEYRYKKVDAAEKEKYNRERVRGFNSHFGLKSVDSHHQVNNYKPFPETRSEKERKDLILQLQKRRFGRVQSVLPINSNILVKNLPN